MKVRKQKLFEIIPDDIPHIGDDRKVEVSQVEIDSRKVKPGALFVAIKGHQVDGHNYIESAINAGAKVIVHDTKWEGEHVSGVIYIASDHTAKLAGVIAHNFYGRPSHQTNLIGVTGTNGKTSVATLLYQSTKLLGYKVGLISTVHNRINDEVLDATHTTPDAIRLNELLAEMVDEGCDYVFMEVSSHAIDQSRIAGLDFKIAAFTNISHDHLDYHDTFKEYIWTKKKFFDYLDKEATAISNIDDKRGEVMLQNTSARKKTFALHRPADFKGKVMSDSIEGLQMMIDGSEVFFQLSGQFNAYNLLTVYAILTECGFDKEEIFTVLSQVRGAEGRFEKIIHPVSRICAIVDYAHTPDALENVLSTIAKTKDKSQRVITVVGCGGDRDTTKRPKMAAIAAKLSDYAVLTSDNPRSEDPESILDDMMEGIADKMSDRVIRISDRREAIKKAVEMAEQRDIILVAGKGHEKYQDIKGEKFPFDDKQELKAVLLKDIVD